MALPPTIPSAANKPASFFHLPVILASSLLVATTLYVLLGLRWSTSWAWGIKRVAGILRHKRIQTPSADYTTEAGPQRRRAPRTASLPEKPLLRSTLANRVNSTQTASFLRVF